MHSQFIASLQQRIVLVDKNDIKMYAELILHKKTKK